MRTAVVPVIAALLVGGFILSQSPTDQMTTKQKLQAYFVAFLNSLWLALVATGVDIVPPPASFGAPTPTPAP